MEQVLKDNNFRFKKALGQNFINDENLLRAIVKDSGVCAEDIVVEIGAGSGNLTKCLSESAKFVYSFETDTNLKPVLEEKFKSNSNVKFLFEDFLKSDLCKIEEQEIHVVANVPYYITTPILFRLFESRNKIKTITLLVQKEVAERIVAKPRTKDYSTLSVNCNFFADIKIMRIVSRKNFVPQPKVDSAVIKFAITNRHEKLCNVGLFQRTVKGAFMMRRKLLASNLQNSFSVSKEALQNIFSEIGLNPTARGEELSLDQFIMLTKKLEKII